MPKRYPYIGDPHFGSSGYSAKTGDPVLLPPPPPAAGYLLGDSSTYLRTQYPTITSAMIADNSMAVTSYTATNAMNQNSTPAAGRIQLLAGQVASSGSGPNDGLYAIPYNSTGTGSHLTIYTATGYKYALCYRRENYCFFAASTDNTTFFRYNENSPASTIAKMTHPGNIGSGGGAYNEGVLVSTRANIWTWTGKTGAVTFKYTNAATAVAAANGATITWTNVTSNISFNSVIGITYNYYSDTWILLDLQSNYTTLNVYRTTGENLNSWSLVTTLTWPNGSQHAYVYNDNDSTTCNEIYIVVSYYVSSGSPSAVYRSQDSGQTWAFWFTPAGGGNWTPFYFYRYGTKYVLNNSGGSQYWVTSDPTSTPSWTSISNVGNVACRWQNRAAYLGNDGTGDRGWGFIPIDASFMAPASYVYTNGSGVAYTEYIKL